ncbi:GAF domain-containing protein [Aureibacter tunicatorum]|uniref:Methyl-accepting chemotaxis protein n=1 Tax=Aureibacter tunicatorum TaxID=866807 RepID=A0AAE3XN89_9BACT|nr:GAF domain-containing protein [Aureibacter tunicatorum]MDR6238174.1 methyl-accepting chemotaxis protein [Aureibacter tunicatorum]BDD03207.1 hypothetical protein AUTU_06900 [Aureibacter tunicatorum]
MKIPFKILSANKYNELIQYQKKNETELNNVSKVIKNIKKKKESIKFSSNSNIQQALKGLHNEILLADEANNLRIWETEGLAIFNNILREKFDTFEALGDSILRKIIEYVNANQGSFFILEEKGPEKLLKQISRIAYGRKKHTEKILELNASITGEVVLNKKSIYLTDVPDSYISIGSGLGEAKPKNIFIFPVHQNEKILGVIEIASFQILKPHVIKFLELLGSYIGASIFNINNTLETQKLLHESQEQTEMLKAQEEELRQNTEELKAIQEEMSKKQNELIRLKDNLESEVTRQTQEINESKNELSLQVKKHDSTLNAIKSNTIYAELSPQGIVLDANQYVCDLFQVTLSEVLGQKRVGFEYHPCFDEGKSISMTTRVPVGKVYKWVRESFTPIMSDHNKVIKIINIAQDITDGKEKEIQLAKSLEEIQTQEEELRQQMEEMNSIQEELHHQKDELFGITNAINQIMGILEFDKEGTIYHANEFMLKVAEQKIENVIHNNIDNFKLDVSDNKSHKELWDTVDKYGKYQRQVINETPNGNAVKFDVNYLPFMNNNNVMTKIICICRPLN